MDYIWGDACLPAKRQEKSGCVPSPERRAACCTSSLDQSPTVSWVLAQQCLYTWVAHLFCCLLFAFCLFFVVCLFFVGIFGSFVCFLVVVVLFGLDSAARG
jgi:hypothetical protein